MTLKVILPQLFLYMRLNDFYNINIRLMAKDLKAGIITVKRAYEELEKEGIVVNFQGRVH